MSSLVLDRQSAEARVQSPWLMRYYFARFGFSAAWIGAACAVTAAGASGAAAALLVGYPLWDAAANVVDARRHGGLAQNPSQRFNTLVSAAAAVGLAIALRGGFNQALIVFGVWAALSGLFQLVAALRRWSTIGGQWPMILSGAQSMIAGVISIKAAGGPDPVTLLTLVPYVGFGAFYFLLSGLWLAVPALRRSWSEAV